jgi:hypothetical protein
MTVKPAGGARVSPKDQDRPGPEELAELALVVVVLAQGLLLGAWLGVFPAHALRVGGFPPAPGFFVRWAGILQTVLAAGYALEWIRFRRVTLLIVAKALTAVLLGVTWAGEGLPLLMMIAVPFEGSMALAGALLHGPSARSRRARARLRLVTPAPTQIRPAGRR